MQLPSTNCTDIMSEVFETYVLTFPLGAIRKAHLMKLVIFRPACPVMSKTLIPDHYWITRCNSLVP